MAATSQKAGLPASEEPPCPDPSAHSTDARLQEQASKAALQASSADKEQTSTREVLGPDGKLSSASAAASLKYAKPQDLPGFPSVGIDTASSGNKAANLANSNQRVIEPWRPEQSSSASKAALLAANHGGKLDLWQHQTSGTGYSAAGIAMSKPSASPSMDRSTPPDAKQKALLAATKSLSGGRTRASSNPSTAPRYPDEANSAANALSAATVANRPAPKTAAAPVPAQMSSPGLEAARVKNLHSMPREMYTEHPPVSMEVEERQHKEALRASAISMAKGMYEKSQKEEVARSAGYIAATRSSEQARTSTSSDDVKSQAVAYIHLQEAAQKLAAERLAKLDPDGVYAYREHYGYSQAAPRSKLSLRGRHRKSRSTEDAGDFSSDEESGTATRSSLARYDQEAAAVETKKRTTDRENLLAAAQRSVQAKMQEMDDRVFLETGKVPPALMEEWTANARAKAMADSDKRMENHGKVHIGGGKFMDQADVDAIAQTRMQPTLDEISDQAERQRARDEELRLDIERRKAEAEAERQREKEVKAELKKQRDDEKQQQREAAAAEKQRLQEEKEQRKLQERMSKAEQKQIQENRDLERKLDEDRAKEEAALDKQRDKEWIRGKEGAEIEREKKMSADEPRGPSEDVPAERDISPTEDAEVTAAPVAVVPEAAAPVAVAEPVGEPVAAEPVATEPIAAEPITTEPAVAPASPVMETATAGEPSTGLVSSYENARDVSVGRRDSRFKGIFSKFKRSSKSTTTDNDTLTSPKVVAEDAPVASGAIIPGPVDPPIQNAEVMSSSVSSASSVQETQPQRQSSEAAHEESKDQVEELSAPKAQSSIKDEGSPSRTNSKFQEEL